MESLLGLCLEHQLCAKPKLSDSRSDFIYKHVFADFLLLVHVL